MLFILYPKPRLIAILRLDEDSNLDLFMYLVAMLPILIARVLYPARTKPTEKSCFNHTCNSQFCYVIYQDTQLILAKYIFTHNLKFSNSNQNINASFTTQKLQQEVLPQYSHSASLQPFGDSTLRRLFQTYTRFICNTHTKLLHLSATHERVCSIYLQYPRRLIFY